MKRLGRTRISTLSSSKSSLKRHPRASKSHQLILLYTNVLPLSRAVDDIFEALSYCASLHPDPNGNLDDPEDDAFYEGDFEPFNGDDGEELSEVGRVRSNFTNDSRYQPY